MFNNNGGQGYGNENYFTSEAYHRQLKRNQLQQEDQIHRMGNDLASWRNHCAALENTLAQWQQSHARQAEQIRQLEADWAELRQNADNSIARWEAHSNKLKADNAALQARLEQAENRSQPAQTQADDVQATITALQHMNTQLQEQVASLEADPLMEEAGRRQRISQLLTQHMDLAEKVSDAQRSERQEMAVRAQPLAELQILYETLMTRALCLEDELRLEDER